LEKDKPERKEAANDNNPEAVTPAPRPVSFRRLLLEGLGHNKSNLDGEVPPIQKDRER